MPVYNLACRTPLPPAIRQRVVDAITDTHCELTGAPARFVNVVFLDGYPLSAGRDISVLGGVRSGGNRTPEAIDRLRAALQQRVAQAADRAVDGVEVTLLGVPASWVMEGGRVMPEPGAEDDWLEHEHAEPR